MAYQGSPGVSTLAKVMSNRIKTEMPSDLLLDFGSIQGDNSLLTNTFPVPIPKSDYVVCRSAAGLMLKTEGGQHGGHDSGNGSHNHDIEVPKIFPGDRVLVAWVQNEPVVIDVIVPAVRI